MVVHAYYPLAETRVQREAESLVRAGYAVDVICLRDVAERSRECYRGVQIHRLDVQIDKRGLAHQFVSYLHFGARAAARVAQLQRRLGYRSVQVHNLPDFLVFCAVVPKLRRVPVILDLHDLMPEFFAGRFGDRRRFLRRMIRLQERLACAFADHVITVSEHWRGMLIKRGVPPGKCSVVMNVADDHIFAARPADLIESATAARDTGRPQRFALIYHGTVTHRYGLDLALQAVARLRDVIPEIHLTILGKGDGMPALVALRAKLQLERFVDLRDEYVSAEQLPGVIARADLGVVPYRDDVFTDGLVPTKLMEYAALGVPCVAARTTAIDRYFRDSMVAFFGPGDADDLAAQIFELYRDPTLRAELARGSAKFVRRYNWGRIGNEYVALVNGLGGPVEFQRSALMS